MKNNNMAKRDALSFREKLELAVWRLVYILLLAIFAAMGGIIVVMIFLWFPVVIVKVIVAIALVIFGFLLLTKKHRQRAAFVKSLKKICNASKYRLVCHRPLGRAFFWREGKPDFEFTANGRRYEVCFLTPKNKSVKIQYEQKEMIKMIVPTAFSGKMAEAFNLQPKVVELPFSEIAEGDETVKILLVNPDRCEVLCKGSEGTLVAAGNGGTYFGRMVYTGKGFLKALEGGDMVPKKKNFNKIDF
ncbi:MAG: hypothetical protein J6Q82_07340 [Clostridia bacterium]|nr:hypothetical protein [Clostridia bacterium]